ncbi:MAG: heme-binding protein, partial [Betaproteobacteria bacterium]|nr:heme-binding protein [Betaproteobacteria bacterium]
MRRFLGDPTALANGVAYSNRAVGNLARSYFPDGITGAANGPLSVPAQDWSIFNVGLQLDLVANALFASLLGGATPTDCTGSPLIANGIQIFPGSVPIYRGSLLVGAIGVSGDGVDQDDMVAFLGLANAGKALNNSVANAPASIRSDTIVPQGEGTRLRYVNCPQAPFNNSSEQNVCAGI